MIKLWTVCYLYATVALLDNLGFRSLKVRSHVTSAFMSTSTLHQTLTHYGNKSNGDANCVFVTMGTNVQL